MASRIKTAEVAEFGDFQTPPDLCASVCRFVKERQSSFASVLEPTCGRGSFLVAALHEFHHLRQLRGVDIEASYASEAASALADADNSVLAQIEVASFFDYDWEATIASLPKPFLILGNPPWVTNAHVGVLSGSNLPKKSNFQGHHGLEAITGKANFDISEWMLIRLLNILEGTGGSLAMLCKTAVARKVLAYAWRHGHHLGEAEVVLIDAMRHFGAAVDACLLYVHYDHAAAIEKANVRRDFGDRQPFTTWGYEDGLLLANVGAYQRWRRLWTGNSPVWRSGIKHDCASIMELRLSENGRLENGLGEQVDLENTCLYPMLKSSHLNKCVGGEPTRFMIVPQRSVGEDTARLAEDAPKTWAYLQAHKAAFSRRASSIYRRRPPFSIFGVGDYSFAPWKVAISGLYKTISFTVVGPYHGRPFVLDDTCYFIPCLNQMQATALAGLLNSDEIGAHV